jgi:hypothetical protein
MYYDKSVVYLHVQYHIDKCGWGCMVQLVKGLLLESLGRGSYPMAGGLLLESLVGGWGPTCLAIVQ